MSDPDNPDRDLEIDLKFEDHGPFKASVEFHVRQRFSGPEETVAVVHVRCSECGTTSRSQGSRRKGVGIGAPYPAKSIGRLLVSAVNNFKAIYRDHPCPDCLVRNIMQS